MIDITKLNIQSEDSFQQACVFWFGLAYPRHRRLIHHAPNEGKRTYYTGNKLKSMGMQKGEPDIFISVPRGSYHGFYIELKTKTGRATPEQKEMLTLLEQQGYRTAIIRPPVSNFIAEVSRYMDE